MSPSRARPLVAGNWKMHGTKASLDQIEALVTKIKAWPRLDLDILICPPATLIAQAAKIAQGSGLKIGGQDCHAAMDGAHTGDISAKMLKDAGASYVILGHSERRTDHHESDALIGEKVKAAQMAGLISILCVGESWAEREAGQASEKVRRQIHSSVPKDIQPKLFAIAYEPVWAIGSGHTPGSGDIEEMHRLLREELAHICGQEAATHIPLLYGGSVKPTNARDLLAIPHVDGALVGGASLLAQDFERIVAACPLA